MANSPIDEELLALAKFPDDNPNPVFRVGKDGTILYANSASIHLLYAWDVEINQSLPDHLKPILQEVFKSGFPKEVEIENQGRIFSFTIAPVAGHDYAYLYAQDITERKRLDQLKDDFISTVSHELRIPLAIVKGAVSNLKDGVVGKLTSEQASTIEIAHNNINRLQRLIHDLLDLSRLESGNATIELEEVHVAGLLRDTEKHFAIDAKRLGFTLKTKCPANLPSAYANADMIQQVLNNLLDNALRFAKKKIVIEARTVEKEIEISVLDDGIGIPASLLQTIFEKFCQVGRAKGGAGYKGTGLGLSICKEIVRKHGGQIGVENNPSHGARFHFTLPVFDLIENMKRVLGLAVIAAEEKQKPLTLLTLELKNGESQKRLQISNRFSEKIQESVLRKSDSLFQMKRPGTFVLILPEASRRQALAVVKRIEEGTVSLRDGISLHSHSASFPEEAKTAEELLNKNLKF